MAMEVGSLTFQRLDTLKGYNYRNSDEQETNVDTSQMFY